MRGWMLSRASRRPRTGPVPEGPVEGAIYVSLTGSDSTGDGSVGNPYRTLHIPCDPTDARCAQPGDTIYIRGGVYDTIGTDVYYCWYGTSNIGYLGTRRRSTSADSIYWGGTEGNPITIKSYPGETAILDGKNHSHHPRSFEDGHDTNGPHMLTIFGHWLVIEDIHVRWGVGTGIGMAGDNNIVRNVRSYKNHSDGFFGDGSNNLWEYCVSHNNNQVATNGVGGDGWKRGTGYTYSQTFGTAAAGDVDAMTGNTWRYCVAYENSDDGFDMGLSKNALVEYCVSLREGVGSSGMGVGYKMSLGSTANTNNVFRYCLSHGDRQGFNSNTGLKTLVHNCTAIAANNGFVLTRNNSPNSECDNAAHNNLSIDMTTIRIVGQTGCLGDIPTTHTHNAGSTSAWENGTYGSDNMQLSEAQLAMVSKNPTAAGFATLESESLARNAGVVVNQASDTDLGAIPYGTAFAGGWDWQSEVYDPEAP